MFRERAGRLASGPPARQPIRRKRKGGMVMELTASMSCLRNEIDALRQTRMSFLENLAEETREMKTAVATMRARFAFARAQRSAKTKGDLTDFVSDLKHRMAFWRQDFRADLIG